MVCKRPPAAFGGSPPREGNNILETACDKNRQAAIRHRRFVIHIRNQKSADIAIEIANFHCVPDERRWRIASPATMLIQVCCYPREGENKALTWHALISPS